MNFKIVSCRLHAFICVEVDCGHYHGNFSIKLLLLSLHCALEALLGDRWVDKCGVMHCLDFFVQLPLGLGFGLSEWRLGLTPNRKCFHDEV